MPSTALIRCRTHVLTTIYQLARWEHCHMSRDTVWSHAPRASRVEFPQAAPDGPAQAQTFSIQSSFGNIKFFDIKLVDDVTKVKFKCSFQDVWFNVLMEFGMSGRNAVHCNILWLSISKVSWLFCKIYWRSQLRDSSLFSSNRKWRGVQQWPGQTSQISPGQTSRESHRLRNHHSQD